MAELLLLAGATAVLVAIPGPNVALIVASALRDGFRAGVVTVAGTTLGVALQLALLLAGLAAVLEVAAGALGWIRWAGVAYLLWLGVRSWRAAPVDLGAVEVAPALFWRGCLVAAANPKTLVFNAAFLPQFVGAHASPADLVLAAGVFLAVLFGGDIAWAAFASSARPWLARCSEVRNRVAGGFLVAAGIGLALARREP